MKIKNKDIIRYGDEYLQVEAVIMSAIYVSTVPIDKKVFPIQWDALEKEGYKLQIM